MKIPPFRLEEPSVRTTSVVFASPHSGCNYRPGFLRRTVLDERGIRSSEDAFVDRLFSAATSFGAPLLASNVPRAYVDLNRNADELDPALIRGVGQGIHNPRVNSGLGVIPRVVTGGRAIYRGKLELAEAQRRLESVWYPYHAALRQLLDENLAQFGEAILIDCHSMPREAVKALPGRPGSRPQVVLGDRYGAACAPAIVDEIEAAFAGAGLHVVRNTPFAGAFIAQRYGRPVHGRHVVQVEIDRSLYMDEVNIRPNRMFDGFRETLRKVIARIAGIGRPEQQQLAAE